MAKTYKFEPWKKSRKTYQGKPVYMRMGRKGTGREGKIRMQWKKGKSGRTREAR